MWLYSDNGYNVGQPFQHEAALVRTVVSTVCEDSTAVYFTAKLSGKCTIGLHDVSVIAVTLDRRG
jgi:hypothetical protein